MCRMLETKKDIGRYIMMRVGPKKSKEANHELGRWSMKPRSCSFRFSKRVRLLLLKLETDNAPDKD